MPHASHLPSHACAGSPCRDAVVAARAALAALLLALGGNALSLPGRQWVGRYDFGYAIRGDRAARPAQVFDDGAGKIYFQARPGAAMPAVFAGRELELLVLQPEGQYFSARTAAGEFTLVLGTARASVRRGDAGLGAETVTTREDTLLLASAEPGLPGGIALPGSPVPASTGAIERRLVHEQPVVFPAGSARLRPEVLAALDALVLRIGHEATVEVDGGAAGDEGATVRMEDGLARARALALRGALIARGIAANRLELAAPAEAEATRASAPRRAVDARVRWTTILSIAPAPADADSASSTFDITPSDRDIATSLRRWARASGYELVWDLGWNAPVNGELRVEAASFPEAVRQVVTGLRAQGYPVRAQAFADRVVRFSRPE